MTTGYVPKSIYVIGDESGNLKIGISGRPDKRLFGLEAETGKRLHLLHSEFVPDMPGRRIEMEVHKILREYRIEGEWFRTNIVRARNAIEEAKASGLCVVGGDDVRVDIGVGISRKMKASIISFGKVADISISDFVRLAIQEKLDREDRRNKKHDEKRGGD